MSTLRYRPSIFPAFLIVAAFLILFAPIAVAQEPPVVEPSAPAGDSFGEVVNVEVVNVEVHVTDKAGRPLTGLTSEDFTLRVEGEATPISNFFAAVGGRPVTGETSEVAAGPSAEPEAGHFETPPEKRLHMAIVVDNGHIRATNRKRVFRHLRTFLDTRLPEDARVTVVSLDAGMTIHNEFTGDPNEIAEILDTIETAADRPRTQEIERRQILGELDTTGRVYDRSNFQRGGTTPDQLIVSRIRAFAEEEFVRGQRSLQSLDRVVSTLSGVPGRKALLYVADGIPNRPGEDLFLSYVYRYGDGDDAAPGYRSSGMTNDYFREIGRYELLPQFQQLAEIANAAGVVWYSIAADADPAATVRGAVTGGGVATESIEALEMNLREPVELAARFTGGRRLAMTSSGLDLDPLAADFGTYYSLGFNPPTDTAGELPPGGKSYRLAVDVPGMKDVQVRHRETWVRKGPDERLAEGTLAALFYDASPNPLEIRVEPGSAERRDDGSWVLPLEVRIPLARLVLVPRGESHTLRLSLFVTSEDEKGNPRQVQKLPFTAAIPDDKLEAALGDAMRYTLPMVVRPGDRRIALGVLDELGGSASYVRLKLEAAMLGGG